MKNAIVLENHNEILSAHMRGEYPEDAHFESYWLDYVSKRIKKLGLSLQQTEIE